MGSRHNPSPSWRSWRLPPPPSARCPPPPRPAPQPIPPPPPRRRNWDARGGEPRVGRSAHRKPDFHRKAKYISPRLALVRRVGFVVNPIAGLGGRVGFKGTDGVAEQALAAGGKRTAAERARGCAGALVRFI